MIRKDIFSVKVWDACIGDWVHTFMTTNRQIADEKKKEIENDHSLGMIRLAKIVHPADWVVKMFSSHNQIQTC